MSNFFTQFSREWFIQKAQDDRIANYHVPSVRKSRTVQPEPYRREVKPCFFDQDAPLDTKMCGVCSDCRDRFR